MEDLVSSSSLRSVLSCSEGQAQSVESSWTDYFVDFMLSEEEKRQQDASYRATEGEYGGDGGSQDDEQEENSMISDAASCAPAAALLPGKHKDFKKLKKKAFKALDNDDCEDTASSPVNSPKVSVLSQMELSPKKRCNIRDLTNKEDGIGHGEDHRMEGMDSTDAIMDGVRFVDPTLRNITPCAELREKGICLFPLSMLLNYQGRN